MLLIVNVGLVLKITIVSHEDESSEEFISGTFYFSLFFSLIASWEEKEDEEEERAGGDGENIEDIEDEEDLEVEVPKKKAKPPGQPKVRKEHLNVVFIGHVGMYSSLLYYFGSI